MSATQSVVPYQGKKKTTVPAATDTVNELEPILDYSFCRIAQLKDILDEEPRPSVMSPRKTKAQQQREESEEKKKSLSRGLRLNNNALTELSSLVEIASKVFENPKDIGWIDLSFNELTDIDPVIAEFENLQILYLHGNQIDNVEKLNILQHLPLLRKLTVHGNPMEKTKDYRNIILAKFPNLQDVNFSAVTKCEKRTTNTWKNKYLGASSKKKKNKGDDDD